jgi:hypothetical protein
VIKGLSLAAALILATPPAFAQDAISGDATAGLVSRMSKGEVHLVTDPALNNRRLALKIVVLNLSGAPQPFGPDAVHVSAGSTPIALASRDALIADLSDTGAVSDESALARANASLPVSASGQTDVTGFTGGMATGSAGVPNASLNRAQRKANPQAAAAVDAVLLKPMTIAAKGADGGQVLTEPLKRSKTPEVKVAIQFAGETHLFAVKVPR